MHVRIYLLFSSSTYFHSLPEDMTEFCFNTYLPEAREATRNILPLPDEEKSKLRGNIFGTLLKLGYAFLWQVIDSFQILM